MKKYCVLGTFVLAVSISVFRLDGQERRVSVRRLPPAVSDLKFLSGDQAAKEMPRVLTIRSSSGKPVKDTLRESGYMPLDGGFVSARYAGVDIHSFLLKPVSVGSENPGVRSLPAAVVNGSGEMIIAEITIDTDSKQPVRFTFSDASRARSVEFNYRDGQVYTEQSNDVAHDAPSGTVGCVLSALKDLTKPCELGVLAASFGACAALIPTIPATEGLSAIIAVPECAAAIGQLIQAVICGLSGLDCGLTAASQIASGQAPGAISITTTPNPPLAASYFSFTISGTNFSTTVSQVVFTGPGCPNNGCTVPNGDIFSRSNTQITGRAYLAAGNFSVQVRNGTDSLLPLSPAAYINVVQGGGTSRAFVTLSFDPPAPIRGFTSDCSTYYVFKFNGQETNGVGVNLKTYTFDNSPQYTLPFIGIPARIPAGGSFSTPLDWCHSPGTSVWTLAGTDDNGNNVSFSGTLQLPN